MEDLVLGFVSALIVGALVVIIPIVGVVFGGIAGWVISLFFDATMHQVIVAIFGEQAGTLELWQIGAFLGFAGAFFKSSTLTKS